MIYLDTNIFIYSADKESPKYHRCLSFFEVSSKNGIELTTSTETIQEVIYLSQNTKQLHKGLFIVQHLREMVHSLLSVDNEVIENYLRLVKKHPIIKSRDSMQAATAITNNVGIIITYDKDFKKFKEIKAQTPEEFMSSKTN